LRPLFCCAAPSGTARAQCRRALPDPSSVAHCPSPVPSRSARTQCRRAVPEPSAAHVDCYPAPSHADKRLLEIHHFVGTCIARPSSWRKNPIVYTNVLHALPASAPCNGSGDQWSPLRILLAHQMRRCGMAVSRGILKNSINSAFSAQNFLRAY